MRCNLSLTVPSSGQIETGIDPIRVYEQLNEDESGYVNFYISFTISPQTRLIEYKLDPTTGSVVRGNFLPTYSQFPNGNINVRLYIENTVYADSGQTGLPLVIGSISKIGYFNDKDTLVFEKNINKTTLMGSNCYITISWS